jgi:Right handed beta helix region
MPRLRLLILTAAAILALGTFTATAAAATIHVHHGQSIQAAVNRAHPGDTIVIDRGRYFQSVGIINPGITLRGAGSGRHGTVLRQPKSLSGFCFDPTEKVLAGICGGGIDPVTGQAGKPLRGPTIVGIRVQGFSGDGMVFFNTTHLTVRQSASIDNGGYGITSFVGHDTRFLRNLAVGDHEAGFYVGDSPHANIRLIGNRAIGNEPFGFLHRDSSFGVDIGNVARDNCVGSIYLDSDLGPAATRFWVAHRNQYIANNRACPAGEEAGPTPVSGIGVAIVGAQHVGLVGNLSRANRPSLAGALAGGIVVMSGKSWGAGDANNNLIARNLAHRNQPADIVWDGTGSNNRFRRNHCDTSQPGGLC